MLKTLLSLFLILSLGTISLAQEPKITPPVEAKTGISFPRTLGPLKRKGMRRYATPELGISYRYAGNPFPIADIYLYDNGLKRLGTGVGKAVRTHFDEVKNEIFLMGKAGYYRSVKKVANGEIMLVNGARKIRALNAVFTYSQPPGKGVAYTGMRTSHVLLTAYKGQFLKIQFTYPRNQGKQGRKAWLQFVAAFGKALNGGNTMAKRKNRNNHKASPKKNIRSRTASR